MVHVDYAFYKDMYLGSSIPEIAFHIYAQRATAQLEKYKRMYTVTSTGESSERLAVCAMAEAMYGIALAQSGMLAVSSASIGSVSVSYGSARSGTSQGMDLSAKGQAREIYNAACVFLDIRRGVM